jgi:hypothetical protein
VTLDSLVGAAPEQPQLGSFFAVTFEQVSARLLALDGCDVEPDGFFVRNGGEQNLRWRLGGHLFDFGDHLYRMELNGNCPRRALEEVLDCLGTRASEEAPPGDESSWVAVLVQEGVTLDPPAFWRWARAADA